MPLLWFYSGFQKIGSNVLFFLGSNLDSFFLGSRMFWVSFGILLRPLVAIFIGLCSQKTLKKPLFFKVFVNEGFVCFEAHDGIFGVILDLLGLSLIPILVST